MKNYGIWRSEYDAALCVVEVFSVSHSRNQQCSRKRGYGPDGEYCEQHVKMIKWTKSVRVPEGK